MNSNNSLKYYIDLFLKYSYIKNKKTTYTVYRYLINKHIKPFWINYNISDINNEDIIKFVGYLNNKNLKNKSIKDILLVLKGIFNLAEIKIKIPLPKSPRPNIIIFSDEDKASLEKELVKNINYLYFSIYLPLYTGIRIRELCALQYSDIDFNNKTLVIKKTLSRIYDKETCKIINNLNPSNEKYYKFYTLKNKVSQIFKRND